MISSVTPHIIRLPDNYPIGVHETPSTSPVREEGKIIA